MKRELRKPKINQKREYEENKRRSIEQKRGLTRKRRGGREEVPEVKSEVTESRHVR